MEQKWNINNGKIMDLKNGKKMEKKPGFFFIGGYSLVRSVQSGLDWFYY